MLRFVALQVVAVLAAAGLFPAQACAASRIEKTIDRDWTFQYFPQTPLDAQAASPAFSDRTWPAIAVPHTWSAWETTGGLHPFIKAATERDDSYWWYGWGWYRKRIVIGRQYSGRLISLEFDGVQKDSRVFVNGKPAGEHKGGYTSFSVDVTKLIDFGRENLIAVAVSNRRDDPLLIPPATAGNFNVYGGIYRDVRLVIRNRISIPFQGSYEHEGGTFIATPEVSDANATVRIRTWVRNERASAAAVTLETLIRDADGKQVAALNETRTIPPGVTQEFDGTASAPHPHLWSPDAPYLYSVLSRVLADGQEQDLYRSPLGFRWFRWDKADKHLYLNGKRIVLNGTNRHQEYPWLGDAIPKWMHLRDLEDMRLHLGHNFQRTAHYPNDPYVYDLSDRLGIVTVEECPNIKDIAFSREVQERNIREMVRRDRNHPSIFFWSIGNETNQPADSKWVWEEDRTRIIHLRRGTNGGDYVQHTHEDMGFENLLRCTIRGWHDGDREFGDGGHPKNGQVTGTEEWQHDVNRAGMIERAGDNISVFLYADHGADRKYRFAPLLYVNPKGWVDAYRNPKYMYYLWQANYSKEPVLFIEPHMWRERYLGRTADITVDSNCDDVTLLVNGRRIGTAKPDASNGHSVIFHGVPVERGVLSASGMRNGRELHSEVRMAGKPARLLLDASSREIPAGRNGIATVRALIVDAEGVPVMGANPPLTWRVEGAGSLAGPSRYESDTLKDGAYEGEMYIDTPVSNVVRSAAKPGEITVTVEAPGLQSGRVGIRAVADRAPAIEGIEEPPLEDAGRARVTRDMSVKPVNFESRKRKLVEIAQDYDVPASADYATAVRRFIAERNPGVDTSADEFRALVAQLAQILEKTHGRLIADDYNFLVRQFNAKKDGNR